MLAPMRAGNRRGRGSRLPAHTIRNSDRRRRAPDFVRSPATAAVAPAGQQAGDEGETYMRTGPFRLHPATSAEADTPSERRRRPSSASSCSAASAGRVRRSWRRRAARWTRHDPDRHCRGDLDRRFHMASIDVRGCRCGRRANVVDERSSRERQAATSGVCSACSRWGRPVDDVTVVQTSPSISYVLAVADRRHGSPSTDRVPPAPSRR